MNGNTVRICLLGANFSTENLGVSALAWSSLQLMYEHEPDAEILILDYHRTIPSYDLSWKDRSVPVLNLSFSRKIFARNHIVRLLAKAAFMHLIPGKKLRTRFLIRDPILTRLEGMDLFAAVSGGDSFSDIYGLKRFLYMSLPQVLALLLGKPLVQLPQTYGPYTKRVSRSFVRYILNRSSLIYSRDYEGLDSLKLLVKKSDGKVRFCYDMAFALEPRQESGAWEAFFSKRKHIAGFNINGLLYKPESRTDFGLASDYRLLVRNIIRVMIRELELPVVLIPHVYGTGMISQSDLEASRLVYEELKGEYGDKLYLLDGRFDQNGIKYIIGRLSFFAGSRMHSCIAALSQNIPAAGLAYSSKFIGVYRSVGMEDAVIDLRTDGPEAAREKLTRIYLKKASFQARLSERNRAIHEKIDNEFDTIFRTAAFAL